MDPAQHPVQPQQPPFQVQQQPFQPQSPQQQPIRAQQPFPPQQQPFQSNGQPQPQVFYSNVQPQPQPSFLPGNKMIKVVGILMIIFGSLGIQFALSNVINAFSINSLLAEYDFAQAVLGDSIITTFGSLLSLVAAALEFTTGLLGVINSHFFKPTKIIRLLAIIQIAAMLIGQILVMVAMSRFNHFIDHAPINIGVLTVMGLILSLILPVLMIIGCTQKNKALNVQQPAWPR